MGCLYHFFSFCCCLLSILLYYLFFTEIKLLDYCEYTSGSVVFGEEFCNHIAEGEFVINESYFQKFMNLISPKIIIRGKFNSKSVIFKTIASASELKKLEKEFSKIFGNSVNNLDNNLLFTKLKILEYINIPLGTTLQPKFRLCPFNSSIENFLNKIPGVENFDGIDYVRLWNILKCNPEPLILKILDPKVWPVPEYFGSCGRLIVVEDCGHTLTHYYDSNWSKRAKITHQLFENALKFTFQDPEFAYYLTDLSPDNIAVTEEGIVKYIDLENVIFVNKKGNGGIGWQHNHTSKHYDCMNCLVFEPDIICSHIVSDHNIYAVCKEILLDSELLPGGFLHSISISRLLILHQFIEECVKPKNTNRFETAEKIMFLLKKYI